MNEDIEKKLKKLENLTYLGIGTSTLLIPAGTWIDYHFNGNGALGFTAGFIAKGTADYSILKFKEAREEFLNALDKVISSEPMPKEEKELYDTLNRHVNI